MPGRSAKKPLLLSAHMDTVTPCDRIRPIVKGARIVSDGTTILGSDDKAAIAMFLEAIRCADETGMEHGPIEILLTCAEEVGLRGMKGFDTSLLTSRYAFVFDSDGAIGRIILQAPFHSTITLSVAGKAAHAGMEPEKGINAITVLAEIITKLPGGRIDHETTANIGTITGGRATNIVAEEATCVMEIRSLDLRKLRRQESIVRAVARETASQKGAKCSLSRVMEYYGYTISPDEPIVSIATGALKKIGLRPRFEVSGGGSDTNILNRAGIRAINCSAGMRKVHTTSEYILIRDLINGARFALALLNQMS